ncbi:neuronal acetylcholine receptor subunit beta-3-like isoform X2 [Convolutriloba macropyga]|uniref:neuronal acetylcholine receptor subunit beta-3-like isoform X2 n=1 Tax=Convolutriloba macropyga TaxID=536237 RepID=UPI003F522D66
MNGSISIWFRNLVMMRSLLLITVIIFSHLGRISCQFNNSAQEMELFSEIQKKLTRFSPPADLFNKSVYPYFDLYKILDIDEKNGLISVKAFVCGYYYVPSVRWNVSEKDGASQMFFPRFSFWTPDIVPLDAVDTLYESFYNQIVRGDNGMVAAYSSLVTIRFSCIFDVALFPFDEQYCPIHIGQWASDVTQYRLNLDPTFNMNGSLPLLHFKQSDQWDLMTPLNYRIETLTEGARSYDQIVINIAIRRQSLFYVVVFVIPTVVLYILSSFVFLLPAQSGEKLTLAITTLLSEIVTLDIISNILPASSKHFPVLGYYILIVVVQMSWSIFLSIFGVFSQIKRDCRLQY